MNGSAPPPESLCALCYHDDRVYHLVGAEYEPHYYHRHHHHNHLQKRKCSSWNVPPIAPLDCCLSYGLVLLRGFTHLIPPSHLQYFNHCDTISRRAVKELNREFTEFQNWRQDCGGFTFLSYPPCHQSLITTFGALIKFSC